MKTILTNKIKNSILILIALFFLTQGCSNKDTGPIQAQPPKDPRTYTWTADTLSFPGSAQTLMSSIWGSSPKDVYTVGHNDRGFGQMFHFDGTKWSSVDLNVGSIDLNAIYGFSANNIYAVGEHIKINPNRPPNFLSTSLIIHYNGTTWTEESLPSVGGWLNTIYGTSNSNIWAGGEDALYHYNGVKWTRDSVLVTVPSNSFFQYTSISSFNSNIYAVGYTDHRTGQLNFTFYLFKESQSSLAVTDTYIRSEGIKFAPELWRSPNGTLYSVGIGGVFKFNGDNWSNIFQIGSVRKVMGTDDNNLFVVGDFGLAYHFNGTDWQNIAPKLSKDTRTLYRSVWTDGTEAFIIEQPQTGFPAKTVIWHGK